MSRTGGRRVMPRGAPYALCRTPRHEENGRARWMPPRNEQPHARAVLAPTADRLRPAKAGSLFDSTSFPDEPRMVSDPLATAARDCDMRMVTQQTCRAVACHTSVVRVTPAFDANKRDSQ